MNLKSYVPYKREHFGEDVVSISKSHQLIFYRLPVERLKLKEGQYTELLFDQDELTASGKVSKIYLKVHEAQPEGIPAMKFNSNGVNGTNTIQVNVVGLLKQIKYAEDKQRYYRTYPHQIGATEYIVVDLGNPVTELDSEE